ncbi:helix-turn-helix domain-containing protein [Streptomyces sp. NPDC048248]|uniref:helix-turn-helix domain-containing protein n=1 Tax=Streptomyces sp. NPDC048248 TaxID=3365523 RepID=UPI0037119774
MPTERDLSRRARHRLAVLRHVEEVSGSVAATCRYYGISRPCYYTWLRRYEAEGLDGLKDRSSAPHHTPHANKADVVEKILWLRQQYHFGPAKIAMQQTGLVADLIGDEDPALALAEDLQALMHVSRLLARALAALREGLLAEA